jgi:DNA primase
VLLYVYHAKQAIAKQNNCFLVEGYTDVIQFHQSGIENVVLLQEQLLAPNPLD